VFEVELPGGLVVPQETQPDEESRLAEKPEVA